MRSAVKRRTASRISSCTGWSAISGGLDVGDGVVAEELAALRVALRGAVDAPAAELEDACRAIDVLVLRRAEERRVELGSERVVLHPEARLDREPHRAVRRGHERRAVDDA